MAIFDPTQITVLLNGYEINDWADGSAFVSVEPSSEVGAYTIGADGKGVFVTKPDRSVSLTLELKQHSENNKWLDMKKKQQLTSIKTFVPFSLEIRDLVNADLVSATGGYFTALPKYARGSEHNNTTWKIVFEQGSINLEKGHGN